MSHIPVLVFETDPANSELLDIVLTRQGIAHVSCLVPLKKAVVPPLGEYFRLVLERHSPRLLITSWRHIGPTVRMTARTMAEPRPVEKWVVSGYSIRELDEYGAVSWVDMIYEKPISPLYLAEEVERRLLSMPSGSGIIVSA